MFCLADYPKGTRRKGVLFVLVFASLLLQAVGRPAAVHAADLSIEGNWKGFFEGKPELSLLPAPRYACELSITRDAGQAIHATLYVPGWGEKDWPLNAQLNGRELTMQLDGVGRASNSFDLILAPEGGALRGQYVWASETFKVSLERTKTSRREPQKSQIPVPPFPYSQERVRFKNRSLTITGILTLPKGQEPRPAVVLIPGSSPHLADPQIPGKPDADPWMSGIADQLTRAGFATLRTDSRGIGGTGGDLDDATLSNLAADAHAAVTFLQSRKEVKSDQVGLMGHSQGANVAEIASSEEKDVAFLILLGGAGLKGSEVMLEQSRRFWKDVKMDHDPAFEPYSRMIERTFELSARGASAAQIRRALKDEFEQIDALERYATPRHIAELAAHYSCPRWASLLAYEPHTLLSRCRIPVLALNGDLDVYVDPERNAPSIESALRQAKNPDATVVRLKGLDHTLCKPGNDGSGSVID
jgi:pimeloyl-ACP methyl ester carboxylesterase